MHVKMIGKIITEGTTAQMYELKDLVLCLIDEIKSIDYSEYVDYEYKLHKIAYGCHIGEDIAKKWVSQMKNKDGTTGEHWTLEQTDQVLKDKGYHFDKYDWYTVLNMVYSDSYNTRFDTAIYIDLAHDWLDDVDVSKSKILDYYYYVVCKK